MIKFTSWKATLVEKHACMHVFVVCGIQPSPFSFQLTVSITLTTKNTSASLFFLVIYHHLLLHHQLHQQQRKLDDKSNIVSGM